MKRIIYLTFVLLLLYSCSNPAPEPSNEQYGKYIFFSHLVDTKAPLVESIDAMDKFAVVGFKYDHAKTWDTYKAETPIPNVFLDDAGTSVVNVETLICSADGTAQYTPIQGWSKSKRYTFFAYYPIDNSAVTLSSPDGEDYESGVPAIKYYQDPNHFATSMVDVMTASPHKDLYWKSSTDNNIDNGEVHFAFEHRLSSLGLSVKNSSAGTIMLDNVKFLLSGISYKEVVIPLDGSPVRKYPESTAYSAETDLSLSDNDKFVMSSGEVELSDKLILIPQTDLSIKVQIGYTRSFVGDSGLGGGNISYEDTFTLPVAIVGDLTEGKKHLININFKDSMVEVHPVVVSGEWINIPSVDDTFN